jgi:putative redox protein
MNLQFPINDFMKTHTTWLKEQEFQCRQGHSSISIDGNQQSGFSPKALLLAGLAGCSGIDIVEILQKMRVKFSALEIDTETTQTNTHPRVFKDIYLVFKIKTGKENRDKVIKAIELSLEKYCGVSAMLRKHSPIHYRLEITAP